jgi:membrane protein YqaA with SNARE-associated domain
MSLNPRAFGVAGGLTAAVLFVLCAAAVALAPGSTTAFFGYLIHADLAALNITRTLTLGSFVGGLILWTVGTALTFSLIAWFYNRLIARWAFQELQPRKVAEPERTHV